MDEYEQLFELATAPPPSTLTPVPPSAQSRKRRAEQDDGTRRRRRRRTEAVNAASPAEVSVDKSDQQNDMHHNVSEPAANREPQSAPTATPGTAVVRRDDRAVYFGPKGAPAVWAQLSSTAPTERIDNGAVSLAVAQLRNAPGTLKVSCVSCMEDTPDDLTVCEGCGTVVCDDCFAGRAIDMASKPHVRTALCNFACTRPLSLAALVSAVERTIDRKRAAGEAEYASKLEHAAGKMKARLLAQRLHEASRNSEGRFNALVAQGNKIVVACPARLCTRVHVLGTHMLGERRGRLPVVVTCGCGARLCTGCCALVNAANPAAQHVQSCAQPAHVTELYAKPGDKFKATLMSEVAPNDTNTRAVAASFARLLFEATAVKCPWCAESGLAVRLGRKDDNCANMRCDTCGRSWCYVCRRKQIGNAHEAVIAFLRAHREGEALRLAHAQTGELRTLADVEQCWTDVVPTDIAVHQRDNIVWTGHHGGPELRANAYAPLAKPACPNYVSSLALCHAIPVPTCDDDRRHNEAVRIYRAVYRYARYRMQRPYPFGPAIDLVYDDGETLWGGHFIEWSQNYHDGTGPQVLRRAVAKAFHAYTAALGEAAPMQAENGVEAAVEEQEEVEDDARTAAEMAAERVLDDAVSRMSRIPGYEGDDALENLHIDARRALNVLIHTHRTFAFSRNASDATAAAINDTVSHFERMRFEEQRADSRQSTERAFNHLRQALDGNYATQTTSERARSRRRLALTLFGQALHAYEHGEEVRVVAVHGPAGDGRLVLERKTLIRLDDLPPGEEAACVQVFHDMAAHRVLRRYTEVLGVDCLKKVVAAASPDARATVAAVAERFRDAFGEVDGRRLRALCEKSVA